MGGYLVVRNWERYQHYTNRNPPWIKFYMELLDDYELAGLSYATRLLYDQFLLLAGRTDNLIPNDVRWIAGKTNIDDASVSRSIDDLLEIGFVKPVSRKPPASKPLAPSVLAKRYPSRAPAHSQEAETEKEKNKDLQAVQAGRATAHDDIEFGLGTEAMGYALRLASALQHKDDRTVDVITSFAGKLPPAAFETVREKIQTGNGTIKHDAKYAVSELTRMVDEKQYAA